jgi:hypothetical protein
MNEYQLNASADAALARNQRDCRTCENHDDNGLSGENACSLSRSYRVSCYYGRRQHWEPVFAPPRAASDEEE